MIIILFVNGLIHLIHITKNYSFFFIIIIIFHNDLFHLIKRFLFITIIILLHIGLKHIYLIFITLFIFKNHLQVTLLIVHQLINNLNFNIRLIYLQRSINFN